MKYPIQRFRAPNRPVGLDTNNFKIAPVGTDVQSYRKVIFNKFAHLRIT
jgi:hypothetical protein